MIVTFIEVFLEYLGIVMFMYKTAGKKFVVSKEFLITAFAEYIVVILSGRYIDNRLGMIFLYVMLFFFAKIKLSDNWKTAVRVFGTMLIGIPVMEILIYSYFAY